MASLSPLRPRATPRISANQLAQFMVTPDAGRLGIVRRAKAEGSAGAVRYSDLRRTLRAHAADPNRRAATLDAADQMFRQRQSDRSLSKFHQEDAAASIEVLESYRRMANPLNGLSFSTAAERQPYLRLAGVDVSVNLDLLLMKRIDGAEFHGGALFRIGKPSAETDFAREKRVEVSCYAATLIYVHAQTNLFDKASVHRDCCISVDVRFGDVISAPKDTTTRIRNLTAACVTIAALWNAS